MGKRHMDRSNSVSHLVNVLILSSFSFSLYSTYLPYTKDDPILVAKMSYHVRRIGNMLGNYFDSIACAALSGLHFVGVKKAFTHDR